jgi:peroxiredoxin
MDGILAGGGRFKRVWDRSRCFVPLSAAAVPIVFLTAVAVETAFAANEQTWKPSPVIIPTPARQTHLLLAGAAPEDQPSAKPSPEVAATPEPQNLLGQRFPAPIVKALRPGSEKASDLDLSTEIGKRPVVFAYFLFTSPVSEEVMTEVLRFVDQEARDKVSVYPVTRLGKRYEITELVEKMRLYRIDRPVIVDEDGKLQSALGVGVVPAISLVDKEGILCVVRGSTLRQSVLDEVTIAEAIRMAARGEEPPIVRMMEPRSPAEDLVGEKYRNFILPDRLSGAQLKLADHVGPGRVTALFYWSPEDRISSTKVPGVQAAWKTYRDRYLDVVSIARGADAAAIRKFAEQQKIDFPILNDRAQRFTTLYRVVSTPTLIIIGPDGIIESVSTSDRANYFAILQAKIHAMVKSQPPAASTPPAAKTGS